jgi:hypothetical protein
MPLSRAEDARERGIRHPGNQDLFFWMFIHHILGEGG